MAGVSRNETFDFIVVGAGSAGSAVTGRLVEAGHKVSQYYDISYPLVAHTGGSDRRAQWRGGSAWAPNFWINENKRIFNNCTIVSCTYTILGPPGIARHT